MKNKNHRRKVASIVCKLEQILALERNHLFSIPDSADNEDRQLESEYAVDVLDEVICSLRDIV
jgi:hypothetical protein